MVSNNLRSRFSLVSYNILSQKLLNEHSFLYAKCNPKDLEWPGRGHRILTELLDNQADIICLQEVECDHLKSLFRPKLARYGYECLYKKKTGYKLDGCAIFFKTKLFHLLNYKGVEFNRKDLANLLNRDNVGIIAILQPKFQCQPEGLQLIIANTHLIFNPKRGDIKLAQLKLFLSELEEMSFSNYDNMKNKPCLQPTILCGDLNSRPESDVSNFILKDKIALKSVDQQKMNISTSEPSDENQEDYYSKQDPIDIDDDHPFEFKSVYPTKNKNSQPYVSSIANCIVDHIFYTPKLCLQSCKELLTEDELKDVGPIPNSEFPSDHLLLEAKFTL